MLLPHLQVWGSLQQGKVKWPQQHPNKAELKRAIRSKSPESKFREQGGFFSVSTCCVCLSPSTDWREEGGAARGRGERGTAQIRLPSAWEVTELHWKKSCNSYRWERTHQKLCFDGKVWPHLSKALSSKFLPTSLHEEKQISLDWRPKVSLCAVSSHLQSHSEIFTQCKSHKHCLTSDAWVTSAQHSFGRECDFVGLIQGSVTLCTCVCASQEHFTDPDLKKFPN